ncbi:MAG TPA: hypothetical protein PKA27_11260 [Fimbriimonadaceae bacterium]|nr:hypothetical protein [Fimbriimonadaceae bacterium]
MRTHHELLKQVAAAGPGYRGSRSDLSAEDRAALIGSVKLAGIACPEFVANPVNWVERRAKLFEAGEYPDKGLSISVEQVASLAATFDLPVPILIEHAKSPLELGYLTKVEAVGSELFGVIALTPEANTLLEKSGARSLSVGLTADASAIQEVSLVRHPRVPSARLFSGPVFSHELDSVRSPAGLDETSLRRFVQEGRLVPAQVPFVKALIDEDPMVSSLVIALIENAPARPLTRQIAPVPQGDFSSTLMLPEEVAFYRKHFPDVALEEIAARR